MSIKQHLFIFDTETTGPEPSEARVVQFAGRLITDDFSSGKVTREEIYCLCNPGVPINPEAEKIHGISQEMASKAEPDYEVILKVTEKLKSLISNGDRVVLAGQNSIGFDSIILDRIYREQTGEESSIWTTLPHIDTYIGFVRLFPDLANHQLSTIAQAFNHFTEEEIQAGAHDALFDITMVEAILETMVIEYVRSVPECLLGDYLEIAEWIATPKIWTKIPFGKHKGKKFGRGSFAERQSYVPSFYIDFIVNKFTNPLPDLVATIRHHYGKEFKNG